MMAASKAEELGCKQGDLKCLCTKVDFMYGLRDCSRAICSEQDSAKVVEYGMKVCQGAGVEVTGGNGGNGGASGTGTEGNGGATHTGEGGSGAHVTTIYATETGTDGKVITTPIATSTIEGGGGAHVTTIYSTETGTDGKVITTPVATSTIEGGNGGSGGSVVTYTTNGSQVITTLATMMTTATGTESSGATETSTGSGSESSTGGSGSQTTGGSGGSQTTGAGGATSTSKGLAVSQDNSCTCYDSKLTDIYRPSSPLLLACSLLPVLLLSSSKKGNLVHSTFDVYVAHF